MPGQEGARWGAWVGSGLELVEWRVPRPEFSRGENARPGRSQVGGVGRFWARICRVGGSKNRFLSG
eukprot:3357212-Pyramimonas_sp.AAC.1